MWDVLAWLPHDDDDEGGLTALNGLACWNSVWLGPQARLFGKFIKTFVVTPANIIASEPQPFGVSSGRHFARACRGLSFASLACSTCFR